MPNKSLFIQKMWTKNKFNTKLVDYEIKRQTNDKLWHYLTCISGFGEKFKTLDSGIPISRKGLLDCGIGSIIPPLLHNRVHNYCKRIYQKIVNQICSFIYKNFLVSVGRQSSLRKIYNKCRWRRQKHLWSTNQIGKQTYVSLGGWRWQPWSISLFPSTGWMSF